MIKANDLDKLISCVIWVRKFYLSKILFLFFSFCPVGWSCRIHQLHLCRGVRPPNKCPGYDTKQSDGEVPVMLGLW